MGLKFGMSHDWISMMLIIWPRLLPPGHWSHRMSLLRSYLSLRWRQKNQPVKKWEPIWWLSTSQHNSQHMIGWARLGHIWTISRHQMTTSKSSASRANPECITWLMSNVSTRRQWDDDEVYLERRRHIVAWRHTYGFMWGTLIMALDHRESIQTWIQLADSKEWHDGSHKKV
jgi:hypothetical protein